MKEYIKPETEQDLIDLFKQIALEKFGWECNLPIYINSRLYRSLGRYKYRIDKTMVEIPIGFDFNSGLLDADYPLDKIVNTMKHELVHWYTDKEQGKPCGHNELFIKNCEKFGVTDCTDFERYKKRKKLDRDSYYEARCCGCDRVVAKSKNILNLKRYMNRYGGTVCGCKNGKRYIIDKGQKIIYNHGRNFFGFQEEEEWIEDLANFYKVELCKE